MMHNDKSRSSFACDNTLSQMIRCINIRWELKRVTYLCNHCLRERQFHFCTDVWSVSIRHSPSTCRRTCQSYLSIRGTPLICPVACYRP